jgi:hypothetical protein
MGFEGELVHLERNRQKVAAAMAKGSFEVVPALLAALLPRKKRPPKTLDGPQVTPPRAVKHAA